jgi:hypothetical protein
LPYNRRPTTPGGVKEQLETIVSVKQEKQEMNR